jgi:hypothetical protein
MFVIGSGVLRLQGTSWYFFPKFLMPSLCSPSTNLNLNGFSSKIIQYMAADRDNSSKLGSGFTTRSSTHENWSGSVLHTAFGSHFTKKTPVLALLGTNKIENPFFM